MTQKAIVNLEGGRVVVWEGGSVGGGSGSLRVIVWFNIIIARELNHSDCALINYSSMLATLFPY